MSCIIGAVFPISSEHASRIFNECKTVFVKFTNMNKFDTNSKIIFFVTKEKRLIGEGTVEKIDKLAPEAAWSRYCKELFLNEIEYNNYVSWSPIEKRKRRNSEITVFVLRDLKKYNQANLLPHRFSPSGCYMRGKEYNKIRR